MVSRAESCSGEGMRAFLWSSGTVQHTATAGTEFKHAIHISRTEHQNGECVEKPRETQQDLCLVCASVSSQAFIYRSHGKVV